MSEETPAQLRDAKEAAEKRLAKLEKENQDLLAENRSMRASSAFADAGLPSNLADLFVATNPEAEISKEAAAAFAQQYGFAGSTEGTTEGDEGAATREPPATGGLESIARAGSRPGEGGQAPASTKYLTRDEFVQLQKSDPQAAQKALAEGRVRLRNDNAMASGSRLTGDNPFVVQHMGSDDR